MRICSSYRVRPRSSAALGLAEPWSASPRSATCRRRSSGLPVVSASRVDTRTLSGGEIDQRGARGGERRPAAVRDRRRAPRDAAPGLILTQDLCAVCAASSGEVRELCATDAPGDRAGRALARGGGAIAWWGSRRRWGSQERGREVASAMARADRLGDAARARGAQRRGSAWRSGSTLPTPPATGCPRWSSSRAGASSSGRPASHPTRPRGRRPRSAAGAGRGRAVWL